LVELFKFELRIEEINTTKGIVGEPNTSELPE